MSFTATVLYCLCLVLFCFFTKLFLDLSQNTSLKSRFCVRWTKEKSNNCQVIWKKGGRQEREIWPVCCDHQATQTLTRSLALWWWPLTSDSGHLLLFCAIETHNFCVACVRARLRACAHNGENMQQQKWGLANISSHLHWPRLLLRQHQPLRLCCRLFFFLADECVGHRVLTPMLWGERR